MKKHVNGLQKNGFVGGGCQSEINCVPRPFVDGLETIEPKLHSVSGDFEDPPECYIKSYCKDEGNASCRFIRPTSYSIIQDAKSFEKKKIPFGVVLTPLAVPSSLEEQISCVDYSSRIIPRCLRCLAFINPGFVIINSGEFECNLCLMKNQITPEISSAWDNHEQGPELKKSVFDIIVPKGFHVDSLVTPVILVCLELTPKTILSGIFVQALSNIQTTLENIDYDLKIGIITYDSNINFYSIPDDESQMPSIIRLMDHEDAFGALGFDDLFLSVSDTTQRSKLERLFEILYSFCDKQYQLYSSRKKELTKSEASIGSCLQVISDVLKEVGGRAIIFSSTPCYSGPGAFNDNNSQKDEQPFKCNNIFFQKIAKKLNEQRISVDLFLVDNDEFQIQTIGLVSSLTGGTVYHYPIWDQFLYSEKFYYEIYRNLTRYQGYEVVCKLRMSMGILLDKYYTPSGTIHTPDFKLAHLNSDSYIAISL